MPDPQQDALSPEDIQALIHTQQHLYGAGDARASKLYNYIVQSGYADADKSGALQPKQFSTDPSGRTPTGEAQPGDTRNGAQRYLDSLTAPNPRKEEWQGGAKNALDEAAQGAGEAFLPLISHPIQSAGAFLSSVGNAAANSNGTPGGFGAAMAQPAIEHIAQDVAQRGPALAIPRAAGNVIGGAAAGELTGAAMAPAKEAIAARIPESGIIPSKVANIPTSYGGVIKVLDGPPESVMTRAVKPGKNNVGWNQDIQTALPQMKSAEQAIGRPIANIDDATEASVAAKKSVWSHIRQRLQAAGQMGATIDGNETADAMVNSIDKRTAQLNPELVAKVKALADTYRRPMDVEEAEDFLQSNNRELTGYYATNKVSRAAAEADPTMAATVAEGDALRKSLYGKLDGLNGPGMAQLKKTYGALSNVQKELAGRQMVFARQAPINFPEQMSYLRAGGKALTGDLYGAAKDVAIQRFMSEVNDTDAQIARAFQKTPTAQPFPPPTTPRIKGLLQRGPIQIPGQDASGPVSFKPPAYSPDTRAVRKGLLLPDKSGAPTIIGPDPAAMTPGEQSAAMMQLLRARRQIALPAQAQPIQLPSEFK